MADPETRDVGRDIGNCALRLALDIPQGDDGSLGDALLTAARVCNRRLCPFCEWRRTRVWRGRLVRGLEAFSADHPTHRGLFLTLTVRNCQMHELRDTISHMHRSFVRMTKTAMWPSPFWFRRTEVTVKLSKGEENGRTFGEPLAELPLHGSRSIESVHPHIHALVLVPAGYFGRKYVKQLEWQRQWQMAARLDYSPVVDIRTAKVKDADDPAAAGMPISAILEAAKYASKATDLIRLGPALPAFHWQMKGIRLYGVSGQLSPYITDRDVTKGDLLDTDQALDLPAGSKLSAVAQWFEDSQEYRFTA